MAKRRVKFPLKYLLVSLVILLGGLFFGYRQLKPDQIFQLSPPTSSSPLPFTQALRLSNENFNDTFLDIGISSTISKNPFTVETWVNITPLTSGNYIRVYPIVTFTKLQSWVDYGYIFQLNAEVQETDGSYRPSFSALLANSPDNINSNYLTAISPFSLPPNSWHHLAATSYSGGDYCYIDLFVDGVKVVSQSKYRLGCTVSTQAPQSMYVGRPQKGAGGISGYYLDGMIDELRISKNVRYLSDFVPPTDPHINDAENMLLMHFDSSLNDASLHNYYTQITGTHSSYFPQPTPTPSPSPTPTQLPTTGISCSVKFFKLSSSDKSPTTRNIPSLLTDSRLIDPATNQLQVGDRYIYQFVLNNNSTQDIHGSINVVASTGAGNKEPIRILGTIGSCSKQLNKSVACGNYPVPLIKAGESYITDMGLSYQTISSLPMYGSTRINFNYSLVNGDNGSNYVNGLCRTYMEMHFPSPTPSPSPWKR